MENDRSDEVTHYAVKAVNDVCEWDDRTSPEGFEDYLIITPAELRDEYVRFYETLTDAGVVPPRAENAQVAEPVGWLQPLSTKPSGADAMEPSEIDIHEGAWALVIGTNGKPAAWIDTHAMFANAIYRDRVLASPPAPQAEVTEAMIEAACEAFDSGWPDQDSHFKEHYRKNMRAALVAALPIGESGR